MLTMLWCLLLLLLLLSCYIFAPIYSLFLLSCRVALLGNYIVLIYSNKQGVAYSNFVYARMGDDLNFDFEADIHVPEPVAAPIVTSAPQVNTGVGQQRGASADGGQGRSPGRAYHPPAGRSPGGHDSRSRGGKGQIGGGDARFKTVVCVHWVKGLCMKNERCTFLHEMDPDRMPECPKGWRCKQSDCPFKHTSEEDREECTLYSQGFCPHGAQCRFRHIKRGPEACPEASEWAMSASAEPSKVPSAGSNFRSSLCKHWEAKRDCPFGDRCHFAHGREQLRVHGRSPINGAAAPVAPMPESPLDIAAGQLLDMPDVVYDPFADAGMDIQGLPCRKGSCRFFVLRSTHYNRMAACIKKGKWAVHPAHAIRLSEAFRSCDSVFIFFAVDYMHQFAGCVRMRSPIKEVPQSPDVDVPPGFNGVAYVTDVEWIRACELSYSMCARIRTFIPELGRTLPVAFAYEATELDTESGTALMVMMHRVPENNIPIEAIDDSLKLEVHLPGPEESLPRRCKPHDDVHDRWTRVSSSTTSVGTCRPRVSASFWPRVHFWL